MFQMGTRGEQSVALSAAILLPQYRRDENGPFLVQSKHPKGISEPRCVAGAGESHPS